MGRSRAREAVSAVRHVFLEADQTARTYSRRNSNDVAPAGPMSVSLAN
jgi:hypothetical protein